MNLYDNNSLIESINVRRLIQILKDIKSLSDTFPNIQIAVKCNYSKIKVTKMLKYENSAEMELNYTENNWIVISHNFPEKAASTLLKIGSSVNLKNAVEGFLLLINNLQNYYETLYILDINCIILEPVEKKSCINWRLIKYSKFAFIKIEFSDPLDVNNFNLTFYGKDHIIKELNETYNSSSCNDFDDDDLDIYQKLCMKFKIFEFPYTHSQEPDECSICLCQHNEKGQSSIVCCENPKCDQLFHASCLNQHLKINSFKILNVAVGECPFCKHKISSNFDGFIRQENLIENIEKRDENPSFTEKMDIS